MRIVTIALVGVLVTVGLATGVQAAGSKCTGAKEKATGKKASCKLSLYSKATSKGEGVDNLKLATCGTKFSGAFSKAEAHADCVGPTGDTGTIETKVDAFVSDVNTTITTGGPSPSKRQGA